MEARLPARRDSGERLKRRRSLGDRRERCCAVRARLARSRGNECRGTLAHEGPRRALLARAQRFPYMLLRENETPREREQEEEREIRSGNRAKTCIACTAQYSTSIEDIIQRIKSLSHSLPLSLSLHLPLPLSVSPIFLSFSHLSFKGRWEEVKLQHYRAGGLFGFFFTQQHPLLHSLSLALFLLQNLGVSRENYSTEDK